MTLAIRVIPCLDVADGRVVKGVNFANLRDSGDPVELAKKYFEAGADELTFLDVNATNENRGAMYDLVSRVAEAVFIPLTVGGGIKTLQDVDQLLRAGADKISIGSAGVANPNIIADIADRFGSQVLVLSMDIKREAKQKSGYTVTTHGGRRNSNLDGLAWAEEAIALGAGELLLNSIDADGVKSGFDISMITAFKNLATIPLIASGGAGSAQHFPAAAKAGADALLAASIFHENSVKISEVKNALDEAGFAVRHESI